MSSTIDNPWVVLLAAGDGARLRDYTNAGVSVPKQFCSLHGGATLLQESLHRASTITSRQRICAVVAERHRRWWQGQLWSLPRENIVVQPADRGTANGILLPLLTILERDANAVVVLLPCDHYVSDERVVTQSLHEAITHVKSGDGRLLLLGVDPESADSNLGYIVPSVALRGNLSAVLKFVEKPSLLLARHLIEHCALWSTLIVVAEGIALLRLFEARIPELTMEMLAAVQRSTRSRNHFPLHDLYRRLPILDFSRHLLQAQEHALQVVRVPPCGWSDVGTPEGLAATLARLPQTALRNAAQSTMPHLNLATQHMRLQLMGLAQTTTWRSNPC